MRPGPNMKRQRGRNNGRKPHSHNPHNPHMPVRSQTFDSNGPDVRIRGNAYQVLEKYLALARDATAAGDRIAAENFYQHAEHYYRLINASGENQYRQQQQHMQNPQNPQDGQQRMMPPQGQDGQQMHPQQHQPHDPGAGPQPSAPTQHATVSPPYDPNNPGDGQSR
jgi:hypothetical protein